MKKYSFFELWPQGGDCTNCQANLVSIHNKATNDMIYKVTFLQIKEVPVKTAGSAKNKRAISAPTHKPRI